MAEKKQLGLFCARKEGRGQGSHQAEQGFLDFV